MKRTISIIIFILSLFSNILFAQDKDTYNLFLKFSEFYNSGDFIKAEESMLAVLNSKKNPPEEYIVAAYNNLGVIFNRLGKYNEALEFYNLAETKITNRQKNSRALADIYINKARIYTYQKSFNTALEYLNKGINIYLNIRFPDSNVFQRISTAYLNTGIIYYAVKDYKTALEYFNKSSEIKNSKNLPEKALPFLNIAKTYSETNSPLKAEEFYLKSIAYFKEEFGEKHYRMAEVYFDYGLLLRSLKRDEEALEVHRKALSICLKNYGEKHTLVSLSYKLIGDHYMNQNNCDSALFYYQKSLIAVVKDFNDTDIYANPSIDSVIFDIRLLDNLKSKARALELLAGQQNKPEMKLKTTQKSLETIELAMELIDRIRNNYPSQESRIYLAENEKETYIFAAHLARNLFKLTNEPATAIRIYDIAKKAKAAILRNEITENEMLYTAGIPDTLREKQNTLSANIAAYNNLILQEMRKKDADSKKISFWKDALFEMNREKEEREELIDREYPQYHDLLQKTRPVTLSEIQKQLGKDETIIDYLLSNQYTGGKRELYIFIITKDRLEFREAGLDSLFVKNAEIIRRNTLSFSSFNESNYSFGNYTAALFYMYDNLIKPVEGLIFGRRLIIIPDEEIVWLPFDAFLKNTPAPDQTDYEGLQYLIYDYSFSYGYSSSLIYRKKPELRGRNMVYAFSPDYGNGAFSGEDPDYLRGAGNEIESILKIFRGKKFTGDRATETNFRESMHNRAILHLAMHSLSDSVNSRFSSLIFDPVSDNQNDGKLYNYEISLSRINSPMVVLSACNSGTGTLYYGEGLLSLARSFILAGASSVIKTGWEVNDETGAAVITRFYFHLAKGRSKDEALRLAKLDYIRSNPPLYANPYYWAAYEVLGDNSPITINRYKLALIIITLILILSAGFLVYYFKRRSILSARSL